MLMPYQGCLFLTVLSLLNQLPLSTCYDCLFNLGQLEALPVTAKQISLATETDPLLSQVLHYAYKGWPKEVPDVLKPCSCELTIQEGCLMWGIKVIVPSKYQSKVLSELHTDHPGICRMKALARSYVWWPTIDNDIDTLVKACLPCLSVKSPPLQSPLNPWLWPSKPWSRIHIDFEGPLFGKTYLIIIDAHSKYPEIFEMSSTTSSKTRVFPTAR